MVNDFMSYSDTVCQFHIMFMLWWSQIGLDLYDGCGKILCGKDIFDDSSHRYRAACMPMKNGFICPIIWKVKVKVIIIVFCWNYVYK